VPHAPHHRTPRALAAACAVGLATGTLALVPAAQASPSGDAVVISEVYGGGGGTDPTYKNDFVELYNPTDAVVDLAGMSVQYRSASGTSDPTGVIPLTGTIAAHGFYLVAGSGGSTGAELPPANDSGNAAMAQSSGTVFLADQATALTAPPTGSVTAADDHIVDLVGYGSSNTYEGSPTAALSKTTSASRDAAGTDRDVNGTDLTVGAPTPTTGQEEPPPPPVTLSIAEIQGTGDASPHTGQTVTTEGVVTAAYPAGGFNGFFLQTPGTGGDLDLATHDASDGIFVYSSYFADRVHLGEYVRVTADVSEYHGLTELSPVYDGVSELAAPHEPVKPATVDFPDNDADRESLEGMLVAPPGPYTVTDNYNLNQYAEIGLATGTTTLKTPTEVADAQDATAIAAAKADIEARDVRLDDGASTNFLRGSGQDVPLPYLSADNPMRVGSPVRFVDPVVLDFRNDVWKFQPTDEVTAGERGPVVVPNTRTDRPEDVGGDVTIASFNVLNYFTETGEKYEADGLGECTYYTDRDDNPITTRDCGEDGPRGAANEENLQRQQTKIVTAINKLDADVLSLEEIENSAKYGQDRDAALAHLVAALNAAAGSEKWAYVPSPEQRPAPADEDVIRTAFVYQPDAVRPVGESTILDDPAFHNARDPLAQGFHPLGSRPGDRFVAIVNHFKSKGSGVDDGTGQGNANPDRVAQAEALVAFAEDMKGRYRTGKVFLTGDFNAYTMEDPMQVLYAAGYTDLGSTLAPGEDTYVYGGTVGSLDHILASDPARNVVTGADVWNVNSVESVAMEYSRYNYNATDFYAPDQFRASDHDPLLVGFTVKEANQG
jgi:predicted extracellular nuclease